MTEQKQKRNMNQYINSVPTSKKLKRDKRGFENMANEMEKKYKNKISVQEGTTGYEIIEALKQYGIYEEKKIHILIENRQPDTIRKAVKKLENNGYIVRKKVRGKTYISLSRYWKEVYDLQQEQVTITQKAKRLGDISLTVTMFDNSAPYFQNDSESYFELKKEIVAKHPGCMKVLGVSRLIGVYHHYGEIIPVFKLGNTLRWIDNAEQQVKGYLEQQIFDTGITKAFYFVDDYLSDGINYTNPAKNEEKSAGEALRTSFELSTCYEKAYMFTVDRCGMNQLQFYRSFANIEKLFLEAVFNPEERSVSEDSIVDGLIDGVNCIVLFSGDIIQIKRIRRILEAGMLDKVRIICYDFQEDFLRKVFNSCIERIEFYSYSLTDLKGVFDV